MDKSRIFLHRANSRDRDHGGISQLARLVDHGYMNLEFDVTVTGQDVFKFCHPLLQDKESTEYHFDDELFGSLPGRDVLWIADIKARDFPTPVKLIENIRDALGENVIFSAAQADLLTAVHDMGARTAQFFRHGIDGRVKFQPEYIIREFALMNSGDSGGLIVYFANITEAEAALERGAAFAMMDYDVALGLTNE